jgi:hypothetical protein
MVIDFVPFILAIVLGIAYHLANQVDLKHKKYYAAMISFSSGISITYLTLSLFPDFTIGAILIHPLLFFSVLGGFSLHHIVEKSIYINHPKHDIIKLLSLEERVFYFAYHFILGILLVFFSKESFLGTILFFIPIFAYSLVSSLTTEPYDVKRHSWLASSATFWGVVLIAIIWRFIPIWIYFLLMGIVVGILLYSIVRHHIPFGKKGDPTYFLIGALIYSVLVVMSWYF